jgi:hypothetical protein
MVRDRDRKDAGIDTTFDEITFDPQRLSRGP